MSLEYQYDGTAPTLGELIRAEVRNGERSSFSALPGRITSYDPARMCANAQPTVQGGGGEKPPQPLPPLVCMPVVFPSGGGFSITWDLQPGDGCLIIFSSVSASQWLTSGEEGAIPESPRRQSLSDGIIIPGLRSFVNPLPSASEPGLTIGADDGSTEVLIDALGNLTLTAGASTITMTPAGVITITAGGVTINAGLTVGGGSPTAIGGSSVTLGDGPFDFVALAGLVATELGKIAASLASIPAPVPYVPGPVAATATQAT